MAEPAWRDRRRIASATSAVISPVMNITAPTAIRATVEFTFRVTEEPESTASPSHAAQAAATCLFLRSSVPAKIRDCRR